MKRTITILLLAWLPPLVMAGFAMADWSTARGNAARTGANDCRMGPTDPRVLWMHPAKESFIASPVVDGDRVFVSGLGAFNTSSLYALAAEDGAPAMRVRWAKAPSVLKLPTVSSPAVAKGQLLLGDGMHQTDGASLYCLAADTGRLAWRFSISGELVHIEGSPTIDSGRVFFGAGHGGVVCLDPGRLSLAGKDLTAKEVQAVQDKRWQELLVAYELEKKKNADFAIPPSEDQLPQATPKLVWQQGKNAWHVDAAVAVVDDNVLAASAFLDAEKAGERALLCLSATDGSLRWKAPLKFNPWAGPTIYENTVIVGGSSIRFDPKEIPIGRGEVVALNLADGKVLWRRDVPGGVVSSVAAANGLAIFTATDGKVRAWDISTGRTTWTYDAKMPFFAAPAIAGELAYVADLKGVIHAIQLADGKAVWKLELAKDPAVKNRGMVYGSPVIAKGRLYVATCNLAGDESSAGSVVVCIGNK